MIRKLLGLFLIASALYVTYKGVVEFNHAKNALELFKALFWIVVGGNAFWMGYGKLSNESDWS